MTIRSKQWYTKVSRPPKSRTKSSIGPLPPLRLPRQQEHRTEDRWRSKKFQIFLGRHSRGRRPAGTDGWADQKAAYPARDQTHPPPRVAHSAADVHLRGFPLDRRTS